MRRIGSVFAAFGLLLVTACAPKPELMSAEQLSRPHVVSIIETNPQVIVDPGRPNLNVGGGAMAGVGGSLLAGAAQGFEAARARAERSRYQGLVDQLGPSGNVGLELQREFRAALAAEIAKGTRMPIQRLDSLPASWRPAPQAEPILTVQIGSLLTQDARAVTLQALISQVSWKPGAREPSVLRYDLVAFSSPIQAASEQAALELWRSSNYALLRQKVRELIPEVMTLSRMAFLDAAPVDFANLPSVSTKLPGFSLFAHGRYSLMPTSAVGTGFQPGVSGNLLRRTQDRAYISIMTNFPLANWGDPGGYKPGWAWISVPAGSL